MDHERPTPAQRARTISGIRQRWNKDLGTNIESSIVNSWLDAYGIEQVYNALPICVRKHQRSPMPLSYQVQYCNFILKLRDDSRRGITPQTPADEEVYGEYQEMLWEASRNPQ